MIIGIDPGMNGGIALLHWGTTPNNDHIQLHGMPETESDIAELLYDYIGEDSIVAYIEKVHAMPGQGVTSMFNFGKGYGVLLGVLAAFKIERNHVTPQRWQKALGCLSKGDKNVTKRRAQELFPNLKITHKTADALLIAEYGRRLEQNVG